MNDEGLPSLVRYISVTGVRLVAPFDPLLNQTRLLNSVGKCSPALLSAGAGGGGAGGGLVASVGGGSRSRNNNREPDIYCHSGVLQMATDLLDELEPLITAMPATGEIRLVGHSFGGSTLTLLRAMLRSVGGEYAATTSYYFLLLLPVTSCYFLLLPIATSVSCSCVDALSTPVGDTDSRCLPLSPAFCDPSKLTFQPPCSVTNSA